MDQQPKARMHLEGRLQAECVLWYRNEWYRHPRNLWATFNEGKDVSSKLSLGLTPFVSDLLYFEPWGRGLVGIEMKYPGESHEVRRIMGQAMWLIDVASEGWFCDSLEMFQRIIRGGGGIDPHTVLTYCQGLKTKTLVWDANNFLINKNK